MKGAADMLKARWQDWSQRFAALQLREKKLIVVATAVAVLFGGWMLWIEPGLLQAARLKKTLAQQQAEQGQLQAQIIALAGQAGDPDAANRATLQQLRGQLVQAESEIKKFDGILVAPQRVPALLQTLLARHRGLALVSLSTLPSRPLIELPAARADGKNPRDADAAGAMPGGNIYKHGIEIKLAGSYHDLAAYVAELQANPQKLLWGGMSLASRYPVSELTLTLYTLSLEAAWLVM